MITFQELDSRDFWWIANSVLNKDKFSKNSNHDDLGISLPVFSSKTNRKLCHISETPKLVKKAIINLDSSMVPGPDYIPVMVIKNCEPELSCVLAEFFNMCQKESCFPDCWKVSSVVLASKNVGERWC